MKEEMMTPEVDETSVLIEDLTKENEELRRENKRLQAENKYFVNQYNDLFKTTQGLIVIRKQMDLICSAVDSYRSFENYFTLIGSERGE